MQYIKYIAILALLVDPLILRAQVFVIAHKKMDIKSASKKDIQKVFLGKSKKIGDVSVVPINHDENTDDYKQFVKVVLGKNLKQLKRYWARKVFTGKGTPGESKDNAVGYVAANENTISYTLTKPEQGVLIIGKYN